MKTLLKFLLTSVLTAASLAAWGEESQRPHDATAPTGLPSPGASVTGSIGITVYNGEVYLIREGGATKLDAATIPPGHMMTLDGRLVPLPPGTKLPGVEISQAEERSPKSPIKP